MEKETYIQSFVSIRNGSIIKDENLLAHSANSEVNAVLKSLYKSLEVNYPKFFKMDNLARLAFLGAEVLLNEGGNATNTALLFANRSSSLDTDVKHQHAISDPEQYFPSPAVFVYTLPNICLGEISIRHQLNSENSFFIFDAFNPEFMARYSTLLIQTAKAERVLCGWVELFGNEYDAFFYLVDTQTSNYHNDEKTLKTLYNK